MAYVFHNLVLEAMVLAPVDALSDEEQQGNQSAASQRTSPAPKVKASAKRGPTPKPKPKAKTASGKAKAKAKGHAKKGKSESKTEEGNLDQTPEEMDQVGEEEGEEEDVIPKKKPATNARPVKRPAAASAASAEKKKVKTTSPKKLKVYKYRYKTGKWGFKVNGKEVMGVSCQNHSKLCQKMLAPSDSSYAGFPKMEVSPSHPL